MKWNSLADVAADLELSGDPGDPQAIRQEILERIAELHPDRAGGSFASADDEQHYHLLMEARDYLDRHLPVSTSLSPVLARLSSLETGLAHLMDQQVAGVSQGVPQLSELISENSREFTHTRVGSAVFAGISGGILSLFTVFRDVPFLSSVVKEPTLVAISGTVFAVSCVSYALCWIIERRTSRLLERLMSEDGLTYVTWQLIRSQSYKQSEVEPRIFTVSRRRFVDALLSIGQPWHKIRWIRRLRRVLAPRLTQPVAERIAAHYMRELIDRGVVTNPHLRGVERVFVVPQERAKELEDDQYFISW